ncbi:MAG: 2,3-bisphosphoglycerate-independent phosphoglycerate mutase [Bacteriovoracaceae bacterium]
MSQIKGLSKRVLLLIVDGLGVNETSKKNAVKSANTPNLDRILKDYPNTLIEPGGEAVGLPKGVAGNSEVGHMNLGAGRPVRQDLVRINESIKNDTFKELDKFQELIKTAKEGSKRIHLMGLLSDGGVHSHMDHLKAVINYLNEEKDLKVFLHAFSDGRDTSKTSGVDYVQDIQKHGGFSFASLGGRAIGMDRDRRWEKIQKAYNAMTGKSGSVGATPLEYLKENYQNKVYDEHVEHVLFDEEGAVKSEDCVFFINFRPDRARQISLAFTNPKFEPFENDVRPKYFLCMSPYIEEEMPNVPVLFTRENIQGTLSEFLSQQGKKQLKIAETEKYAHVTYFFNGGAEKPFKGEDRILVDSPRDVATYDEKPEMSAPEVCQKLSEKLKDGSVIWESNNGGSGQLESESLQYSHSESERTL